MSRAAVLQMVSSSNVKDNLQWLDPFFSKACEEGAELLVLPENFAFMGQNETDKLVVAEKFGDGEIQLTLKNLAKRYGLWVIAGTIPLKKLTRRVSASCLVYDNHGVCVARYDKIHLFDVRVSAEELHQESFTIVPGDKLVVVDTPVGRVGLSICYDVRFPELYHQLVLQGAELLAVPAAFTAVTGRAHWDVLLRARAIENLCYVLASNQGGTHTNGRVTYGHSMIVEPWGNVVSEQLNETGIIVADIDLPRLQQLRLQFPCNTHHVLNTKSFSK